MAYIDVHNDLPGIRSLLAFRPETARPLGELAEVLLRGRNTLSPGERELIATYVSTCNACDYCSFSHAAIAAAQLPGGLPLVDEVLADVDGAAISPKLKALLHVAAKVAESGRAVRAEDVAAARDAGASDVEIHDTVLIAAAFCMYNRYVDGLGTVRSTDRAAYALGADRIASEGYAQTLPGAGAP